METEGGLTTPQIYGKTWVATHDCAKYKKVATDMLRRAGVQILYHCEMVDVIAEDAALTGLVLHTRSGFTRVAAQRFIDASGDADAVFRMGLRTIKGNNGIIQNPSMMFKIGNVDIDRYLGYWGENTISPPKVVEKLEARDALVRKKVWLFPTVNPARSWSTGPRSLASMGARWMSPTRSTTPRPNSFPSTRPALSSGS
ncbi:MAG: FAD-dependent oxidoreductase [Pseudomonadota bacterium]